MYVIHSPESGTPGAPLRPKSSTPRSGFVQLFGGANGGGRHPFIRFGRLVPAAIAHLAVGRLEHLDTVTHKFSRNGSDHSFGHFGSRQCRKGCLKRKPTTGSAGRSVPGLLLPTVSEKTRGG